MTVKKTANVMLITGITLSVLSVAWWALVYTMVGEQTGEGLLSSFSCLVSVGPECNFMRGMAWLQGLPIYEPPVLWLSLALVVFALFVKKSAVREAS